MTSLHLRFHLHRALALLGLAALIALCFLAPAQARPKRSRAALIRVSTAKLRSGPGTHHKATALLDAGRTARVLSRRGEWLKVRLGTGKEGWVRRDLLTVAKRATRDRDAERESRHARRTTRIVRRDRDEESTARRRRRAVPAHRIAQARPRKPVATMKRPVVARKPITVAKKAIVLAKKPAPAAKQPLTTQKPSLGQAVALAARVTEAARGIVERHPAPTAEETAAPAAPVTGYTAESAAPESVVTASLEAHPEPERRPTLTRGLSRGERLARRALSYRGMPYRIGATGRGAFDCSGFVKFLYGGVGRSLPRTAAEQYRTGQKVAKSDLRPGDLVFFKNTYKRGVSHVGLYIGNGRFVHASSHGRAVRTDALSASYYTNHWAGARRPR